MRIRILPEAERDLDMNGEVIDIYAVLDCRQDPATIDSRLDQQGSKPE